MWRMPGRHCGGVEIGADAGPREAAYGASHPCIMPRAVVCGQCGALGFAAGDEGSEETVGEDHIPG
jgi:hypothetical protein